MSHGFSPISYEGLPGEKDEFSVELILFDNIIPFKEKPKSTLTITEIE